MKKYYVSGFQILQQIKNDCLLSAALVIPFVLGMLFRFGVPGVNSVLMNYGGKEQFLLPYYALFDLFLSMIGPMMFSFSFAMITLEEIDDRVSRYYMITPLGKSGYLLSRIGIPAVLSLVLNLLLLTVFQISGMDVLTTFFAALQGTLVAVITALMIIALSSNKLEGMAVTKLSAMMTLGILAPFFVRGPVEYLFSILPSYWLAKMLVSNSISAFAAGMGISAFWILALAQKFNRKVSV